MFSLDSDPPITSNQLSLLYLLLHAFLLILPMNTDGARASFTKVGSDLGRTGLRQGWVGKEKRGNWMTINIKGKERYFLNFLH